MTNRKRLALETKHKIIAAARQLITARGINGVSVSDITEHAGVAKGSFYTYYAKKEDVLSEIAYEDFDKLKEKYVAYEGADRIRNYITEFVEIIYEGGLELCKSWTSNEILGRNSDICKFDMDVDNLTEVLTEEGSGEARKKAYDILMYIYGAMTVWCMTNDKYDIRKIYKDNYSVIEKITEETI